MYKCGYKSTSDLPALLLSLCDGLLKDAHAAVHPNCKHTGLFPSLPEHMIQQISSLTVGISSKNMAGQSISKWTLWLQLSGAKTVLTGSWKGEKLIKAFQSPHCICSLSLFYITLSGSFLHCTLYSLYSVATAPSFSTLPPGSSRFLQFKWLFWPPLTTGPVVKLDFSQ